MARFKPGQSGNPGGRPKGAHTKRELQDLLRARFGDDWDPVLQMAEIAMDAETSRELRVRCLSEVAPYVRPRLKVTEHSGDGIGLAELIVVSGLPEHQGRVSGNPDANVRPLPPAPRRTESDSPERPATRQDPRPEAPARPRAVSLNTVAPRMESVSVGRAVTESTSGSRYDR